jgi:deazaflavin-dependent oxidoreductase (nitroreductase family)
MDERPEVASTALAPIRPIALGRLVFRPILLWVGVAAVLEVPGRRTGTPHHVTLVPWQIDGTRYLLSFYGATEWVRNLRAAGGGTLRQKGRTETFRAIEVDGDERDRVIAAFRARADKLMSQDFDRRPGAADHPTFKVEPVSS